MRLLETKNFYILRLFDFVVYQRKDSCKPTPLNESQLFSLKSHVNNPKTSLVGQIEEIKLFLERGKQTILDIHETGDPDLVQIEICYIEYKEYYILTWNLNTNKQHSLYQGILPDGQLPTNFFVSSREENDLTALNYIFDQGALIDLNTNSPIQFLDAETQSHVIPQSIFARYDPSKRISRDHSCYLDQNHPGRLNTFVSLTDLIYWERFKKLK